MEFSPKIIQLKSKLDVVKLQQQKQIEEKEKLKEIIKSEQKIEKYIFLF